MKQIDHEEVLQRLPLLCDSGTMKGSQGNQIRNEEWEEGIDMDSLEREELLDETECDDSDIEIDAVNLSVFAIEEEKDSLSHLDIKVGSNRCIVILRYFSFVIGCSF